MGEGARLRWGVVCAAFAAAALAVCAPTRAADPAPDPAPVPEKPAPAEPKPTPKPATPAPAPSAPAPSAPAPAPPAPAPSTSSSSTSSSSGSSSSTTAAREAEAAARARAAAKAKAQAKAKAKRLAEARRRAEAKARARAAALARANDVVGQRVDRARAVHEQHLRPYGLALTRTAAVVAPFEPPVAAAPLPATPTTPGNDGLIGAPVLYALLGTAITAAFILFLLSAIPNHVLAGWGPVGAQLGQRRDRLQFYGVEILFAVILGLLIGRAL